MRDQIQGEQLQGEKGIEGREAGSRGALGRQRCSGNGQRDSCGGIVWRRDVRSCAAQGNGLRMSRSATNFVAFLVLHSAGSV